LPNKGVKKTLEKQAGRRQELKNPRTKGRRHFQPMIGNEGCTRCRENAEFSNVKTGERRQEGKEKKKKQKSRTNECRREALGGRYRDVEERRKLTKGKKGHQKKGVP